MRWVTRLFQILKGKPHDVHDPGIYHKLSLIALFAWIGLGADGLSSSCYGPAEAYLALHGHTYLSIFVALASVLTVFIISYSYSQIITLFPAGGGGYLVASKLLSPAIGMVSGCALIIDYVLTITISVASGTDAILSFAPGLLAYKFEIALLGVFVLLLLNLRGIKESVLPLIPIFALFLVGHVAAIFLSVFSHWDQLPHIFTATTEGLQSAHGELGTFGLLFVFMRSYVMGAGTYTGIEAVSNGMPILKTPRVQTAKRTMLYMSASLSFMVLGLMIAYLLAGVEASPGMTLNAVLFHQLTADWGEAGKLFTWTLLISEAFLLFIAAQTGFLDGPRVLANMALDRWLPAKFALLNERLVAQNGIIIMGGGATIMMLLSRGSVEFLIVLYSINVFITFMLSQLGMILHWWRKRHSVTDWFRRFCINGIGLLLTSIILISIFIIKFTEGGWITLFITAALVGFAFLVKRHYFQTAQVIRKINRQTAVPAISEADIAAISLNCIPTDRKTDKTAVLLVNGFDAIGVHAVNRIIAMFGDSYHHFVFVSVGIVDAGNFKGVEEMENLEQKMGYDLRRYIAYVQSHGLKADGFYTIGTDIVDEVMEMVPQIQAGFLNTVFFGGFLIFKEETFFSRILHNHTLFALQRKLCLQRIPFVAIPIQV